MNTYIPTNTEGENKICFGDKYGNELSNLAVVSGLDLTIIASPFD